MACWERELDRIYFFFQKKDLYRLKIVKQGETYTLTLEADLKLRKDVTFQHFSRDSRESHQRCAFWKHFEEGWSNVVR